MYLLSVHFAPSLLCTVFRCTSRSFGRSSPPRGVPIIGAGCTADSDGILFFCRPVEEHPVPVIEVPGGNDLIALGVEAAALGQPPMGRHAAAVHAEGILFCLNDE